MPRGHYKPKGFTKEELERLEEISFKNMVVFYHEELNRFSKGELLKEVLTKGDRRCLRRLSILRFKRTGDAGRRLEITPKAKEILKEIDKQV